MNGDFEAGDWLIRPKLNAAIRHDVSRHLSPKAVEVLVFLARRQGDVVSKDEIFATVWSGSFVTDDALGRCIGELRRVLEDDAREPSVIQTIAKRGYRLVSPVRWLGDESPGRNNGGAKPDRQSASVNTSEPPTRATREGSEIDASPCETAATAERAGGVPPLASRQVSRRVTVVVAALTLVAGVAMGVAATLRLRSVAHPPVVRTDIRLEAGYVLAGRNSRREVPTRTAMTISSDGSFVVYSAKKEGTSERGLFIRRLGQAKATAIAGTEGAIAPFLSPDGRRVGFVANQQLRTASIDGGSVVSLGASAVYPFGASWGSDGYIVFPSGAGLSRAPERGGDPEVLATRSAGEYHYRLPHYLPGGKGVMFTVTGRPMDLHPRIAVVDEAHRTQKVLEDAADARYVATGHLVFVRAGELMAVRFDLDRLRTIGPAIPLGIGVAQAMNERASSEETDAGQFAVSESGALVYAAGGISPDEQHSLVWVDQQGREDGRAVPRTAPYMAARLSPDGRKIAYTVTGRRNQVWVFDLNRGVPIWMTKDGVANFVVWTRDSQHLVFGWSQSGPPNLLAQPVDQSERARSIAADPTCTGQGPGSWSPDGNLLAFWRQFSDKPQQILIFDRRSGSTTPFIQGSPGESLYYPEFSPDGLRLAYASNESGRQELYVRAFPNGGKWQVTSEGGSEPLWAPDGRRLFYRARGGVWAVDLDGAAGPGPGKTRLLFPNAAPYLTLAPGRAWDLSADGRRFLMIRLEDVTPQPITALVLVQNWFEELQAKVPTGR